MAKRIRERVQIGTDVNGKPIYEWATGYSRQEVFLNAAAILQKYGQIEAGPQKEPPKTPYFETYMEEWWKLYKLPKLRHTTRTTYRNLLDNHILPFFKGKRLEEITTSTIQEFYNANSGKSLASVRQMSVILHQIFDLAVEDKHMSANPTNSKRLYMSGSKKKRNALGDEEIRSIMKDLALLEATDKVSLAILLYTGMRRGEVLALRWEKIDWKRRLIYVDQAVTFLNNQPVLGQTKSEAGNRCIPLDDRLAEVLRPFRQISGYIVGDGEKPMTERTFTRMWQRIGRRINLYGATPHIFRHTYITLAASSGIDVKTLQGIAGHSDIKMTMDRYAHHREEKVIEAREKIGGVFSAL